MFEVKPGGLGIPEPGAFVILLVSQREANCMTKAEEVRRRIEQSLPGARVEVVAFSGDDHLRASVTATQFAGKSLVEQHRLVYASLDGLIGGAVHALQLETRPMETDD